MGIKKWQTSVSYIATNRSNHMAVLSDFLPCHFLLVYSRPFSSDLPKQWFPKSGPRTSGNFLEMLFLGPHSRLTESESLSLEWGNLCSEESPSGDLDATGL